MVKAELLYNPYSLHTEIRFNGRSPRMNSLVEKYTAGRLEDWVSQIPEIFCAEMNGYGFGLDFSGTKLDFQETKRAFQQAGISDTEVMLFFKNELEGREKKLDEVYSLLDWLDQNRNRNFNFEECRDDYQELFEQTINLVMINGPFLPDEDIHQMKIIVDNIEDTRELNGTELADTPIAFWADADASDAFQRNLSQILKRKDISGHQLFFIFPDNADEKKVRRIIEDLGVHDPSVIAGIKDEKIQKYMMLYPVTSYISDVLHTFTGIKENIHQHLEMEVKKSKASNQAVHKEMEENARNLAVYKSCLDKFENRDNIAVDDSWTEAEQTFLSRIEGWQHRRAKISKTEDARRYADDLNRLLHDQYRKFTEAFAAAVRKSKTDIDKELNKWYAPAAEIAAFHPEEIPLEKEKPEKIPEVQSQLLLLKEEKDVMVKGIFDKTGHPEHVVNYYIQKWRESACSIVRPVIDRILKRQFDKLQEYYDRLSQAYMENLQKQIERNMKKNDLLSSQLSDEERKLQQDLDWLGRLSDQLDAIERD